MGDFLWWQIYIGEFTIPVDPMRYLYKHKFRRQQVQSFADKNQHLGFRRGSAPNNSLCFFFLPPLNILDTNLGEYSIPMDPVYI